MSNININFGGGFISLLTIAFIVLKLIGEITWGWVWVLSPLWIPLGIVIGILIIILLIYGLPQLRIIASGGCVYY